MSELSLRDVTKRYGASTVLDAVSLNISSGAYVALLGPSGSGKSTLLRGIAGLIALDGGLVRIGEQVVFSAVDKCSLPPEQRHLGMVFQSYAVWPHMSVGENVAYPLRLKSRDRTNIKREAMAALERVGLSDYYERSPGTLSGGQQQRVALARALCMKPRALLLDEPLANLDPHLRADLCDQFRHICAEQKLTFIHVTHDRQEALQLATMMVLLRDGRVVQHGSSHELFAEPGSAFVAEFVAEGISLNGELQSLEGPRAQVRLKDGGCVNAEWRGSLPSTSRVRVVVPRHALRAASDGPLLGTVQSNVYGGEHRLLTVALVAGGTARLSLPLAANAFAPGEAIRLAAEVCWAFAHDGP